MFGEYNITIDFLCVSCGNFNNKRIKFSNAASDEANYFLLIHVPLLNITMAACSYSKHHKGD